MIESMNKKYIFERMINNVFLYRWRCINRGGAYEEYFNSVGEEGIIR